MGPTIGLFALFLLVLVAVAFAAVRLFAARGADNRHDPAGCLMGCGIGVGLLVLGLLGLASFVAAMVLQVTATYVEHNPIQRVYFGTEPEQLPGFRSEGWSEEPRSDPQPAGAEREAWREPWPPRDARDDARRPLHVVFEIAGHDATPPDMTRWLREWSEGEAEVRVANRTDPRGRQYTLVDVALPADWRELREIEREVRKLFPGASWARGLRIDFKGVSREW
jgi:hypothetical protein